MLFRKMIRDMGRHKTQFISIFLMAFLGVFIFAGIGGEWTGLRNNVSKFYRETNFADVWLYGAGFSAQDENAVTGVGGVTGAERSLVVDGVGKFSNNPKISLHFVEKNEISKPYLVSGEAFSTQKDGIWIDARFAKAHRLAVGDPMSVTFNGLTVTKTIEGTIDSPEYVYNPDGGMTPDFSAIGYAYLSYRAFPNPQRIVYNRMMFTVNSDPAKLESRIDGALGGKDSVYLPRKNHPSYSMFEQEIEQHKAMGSIFPVAFLLIALLTILTTMTRIVTNQRTQIGTLKALGFKKRQIVLHYVGYGFWVSLSGSVLGAAVGPLTLPKLFYPTMSAFYTLPEWKPSLDISFYLMAAVMVFLCTLITYLACRRVLMDSPAKMLRPKSPKLARHGLLEKTPLWKKLGFNLQWNVRDIFRNKARSVMAVIGVIGCTALLVSAFGMYDDMNDMKNWEYRTLERFQSKLVVKDTATPEQIADARQAVNGQELMEGSIEIKANGKKESGSLTVPDHAALLRNTDANRKVIALPENGLSLSYKMAARLKVKKGDTIRWHIYGDTKWVDSRIEAVYRDPEAQGITLSRSGFEKLGFPFRATSIVTADKVNGKFAGISEIQRKSSLIRDWDNMTQAAMTMVDVLIAAASLLAVVVLYNLGILSFTEMEREFATLKVLGFQSAKIRRLLISQNLLLSLVGFLLGIPVGKWLIDDMVSMMGDSFDMITVIHAGNVLLSFGITFLLCYLVNRMFYGRIKKLDMVGSLKGVE